VTHKIRHYPEPAHYDSRHKHNDPYVGPYVHTHPKPAPLVYDHTHTDSHRGPSYPKPAPIYMQQQPYNPKPAPIYKQQQPYYPPKPKETENPTTTEPTLILTSELTPQTVGIAIVEFVVGSQDLDAVEIETSVLAATIRTVGGTPPAVGRYRSRKLMTEGTTMVDGNFVTLANTATPFQQSKECCIGALCTSVILIISESDNSSNEAQVLADEVENTISVGRFFQGTSSGGDDNELVAVRDLECPETTVSPTEDSPSAVPSSSPTSFPSTVPSASPSSVPSSGPSFTPSTNPSASPSTNAPASATDSPTPAAADSPTETNDTDSPTAADTDAPTKTDNDNDANDDYNANSDDNNANDDSTKASNDNDNANDNNANDGNNNNNRNDDGDNNNNNNSNNNNSNDDGNGIGNGNGNGNGNDDDDQDNDEDDIPTRTEENIVRRQIQRPTEIPTKMAEKSKTVGQLDNTSSNSNIFSITSGPTRKQTKEPNE